jgi:hypothetical protein
MDSKSTLDEDPDLPENKLWDDEWLLAVDDDDESDDSKRHANTRTGIGRDDRHNRFKHAPVTQRGTFARLQLSWEMPGLLNPGSEQPGIFFDPLSLNLPIQPPVAAYAKEEIVNQEEEVDDDFHDSDAEDVYDLYLACNGVLYNGLLDSSKLDELTPEEAAVLNVPRLREIWRHTATGCQQCQEIIRTLNIVRSVLREEAGESYDEQTSAIAMDQADSISH